MIYDNKKWNGQPKNRYQGRACITFSAFVSSTLVFCRFANMMWKHDISTDPYQKVFAEMNMIGQKDQEWMKIHVTSVTGTEFVGEQEYFFFYGWMKKFINLISSK